MDEFEEIMSLNMQSDKDWRARMFLASSRFDLEPSDDAPMGRWRNGEPVEPKKGDDDEDA